MSVAARELGTLYRTQARVVAVESQEDLFELLSSTLRALFPNLLRFEFYVTDESGSPGTSMVRGDLERTRVERLALRRLPDAGTAGKFLAPRQGLKPGARMDAPLLDGRNPVGLIVVESLPECPFAGVDLEILESVAGLFSLALYRLRSRRTEHRRASIDLDRQAAGDLQRRLMRSSLPAGSGATIDARYLPALDVGGDFYDFAPLGDGRVGGAIGDVSGKGMQAALIMSRVSSDLGRALRSGVRPSKVLEGMNSALLDPDSETFVTASCVHLDPEARRLTVSNAGHIPLLVRRETGDVLDCGAASGTPLGMIPCRYLDEHVELRPRDIVLLMTDGLVEALDEPNDRWGKRFLHNLLHSAPHDPSAINDRILAAANEMLGSRPLDDVALVALQLEPR